MRYLLALLLCLTPCWAWADTITVPGFISPAYSATEITIVAVRGGTELDSETGTNSQTASGLWKTEATFDLSSESAGYVEFYFIDPTGEHVCTPKYSEIDEDGAEVDRLPFLDDEITSRLAPTTAGRTLDVTATGAAGIDWGNIENATTTVSFTGSTVGSVTLLNGIAANVITAAATAADFSTEINTGMATSAAQTTLQTDVTTILNLTAPLDDLILDLPTNAELATSQAAADDATLAAIAGIDISGQIETVEEAVTETIPNLIEELEAGGQSMPRVNRPPGRAFALELSSRDDGTHVATKPARLQPGTVGDIAVGVDVAPVFGELRVQTVGTPVVSGGSITATALGPRDDGQKRYAMVELSGTATASETRKVTVPVTMESGEQISATFNVEVSAQ